MALSKKHRLCSSGIAASSGICKDRLHLCHYKADQRNRTIRWKLKNSYPGYFVRDKCCDHWVRLVSGSFQFDHDIKHHTFAVQGAWPMVFAEQTGRLGELVHEVSVGVARVIGIPTPHVSYAFIQVMTPCQ